MFTQKSVATVVILTIVTCGIYSLVWYWGAMHELYNAGGKSVANLDPTIQFILLFLYVGGVFFAINADDNINAVKAQRGIPQADNKILYIILSLVFPIAMIALVQNEMNQLA
ncbi:protein of unknown function [Ruminococcus sp. YE71]|uniref:DUF4234 domain-containing protein n=1 Tax=unclassified Ruminococcus TaxID=2608920 RepID=UPI00088801CF|nr:MULTISPECIES: DUF4234 domain-containing protein [unclassified Ruminococcus]SDA24179.1 protein of unknown function [Ruminococcus sp. YE78]SFW41523.1 protein of unknown function [Ruminococcus sp. YE71]